MLALVVTSLRCSFRSERDFATRSVVSVVYMQYRITGPQHRRSHDLMIGSILVALARALVVAVPAAVAARGAAVHRLRDLLLHP